MDEWQEKIEFHKKIFKIEPNKILEQFEDLMRSSKALNLECSYKIGEKIHATRLIALCQDVNRQNPQVIFDTYFNYINKLSESGAKINLSLIKGIFGKIST
ncbi:hypothetical protein JW968_05570 [Candidatus Woesearchaeota archaeon]|nr:hypothetical protein [Candidatus Woesearchaeota archaeon]